MNGFRRTLLALSLAFGFYGGAADAQEIKSNQGGMLPSGSNATSAALQNLATAASTNPLALGGTLKITGVPNLVITPTGNALSTFTSLSLQGTNSSAVANRIFLQNLGLTVSSTAGTPGPNEGSVTSYLGMECDNGAGNCWAGNELLNLGTGNTTSVGQVHEVDINNNSGADRGCVLSGSTCAHTTADGVTGLIATPQLIGVTVAGASANKMTTAFEVIGLDSLTRSNFVRGFTAANGITQVDFESDSNANTGFGCENGSVHVYCLDGALASGITGALIRGPNATTLLAARNAAGSADVVLLALNSSNQIVLGASGTTVLSPGTISGATCSGCALTGATTATNTGGIGLTVAGAPSTSGILKLQPAAGYNFDDTGISFYNRASGASTNSRSWMISNNFSASGDLDFLVSSSSTANPTVNALAVGATNASFGGNVTLPATGVFVWNSDTGCSRVSALVIGCGNQTQGSITGTLDLANVVASGTGTFGTTHTIVLTGSATSPVISTSGGNLIFSPNNDLALQINGAAGATNVVAITGSNAGNPIISTTGGALNLQSSTTINISTAFADFLTVMGGSSTTTLGTNAGSLTLAPATGGVTITGLPTSAGAGGVNVCIDTSGVLYKKASCP